MTFRQRCSASLAALACACSGVSTIKTSDQAKTVEVERFSLKSNDGLATIEGQIDYPADCTDKAKLPVVVMIGGTGFFDRDYQFGDTNTERDLLFKDLSKTLTQAGFAVARYDLRGVRCNKMTMPPCPACKTDDDAKRHFVSSCIDNQLRGTMTWDNLEDDFVRVYEHARARPMIDPRRAVVFAHSEGTMHVANLISRKAISPRALLLMGMVAESPFEMIRWQWSSRLAAAFIQQFDSAVPNQLSNDSIQQWCQANKVEPAVCDQFKSPTGLWTTESLTAVVEGREYVGYREEVLTHADSEPFQHLLSQYGAIFASYGWWKRFYTDQVQDVAKLARYDGAISVFNGDLDAATPSNREFAVITKNASSFKSPPRLHSFPGRGHSLSTDPMHGPIPDDAKTAILNEVKRMVD